MHKPAQILLPGDSIRIAFFREDEFGKMKEFDTLDIHHHAVHAQVLHEQSGQNFTYYFKPEIESHNT
jgi:hypothetical protein